MRPLFLALAGLLLSTSFAFASPAAPQNGVDYVTLPQPQPAQGHGKQVEVIEFFMYHCPVCYALEPRFQDWIAQEGERVAVRRIHIPFTGPNDPEAHLYLTLAALGKADEFHPKILKAIHVDHIRLTKDDAIIDWVARNGIDRATFLANWNSFGVLTRLHQLNKVLENYQVDAAPTLVVDGRYVISTALLTAGGRADGNRDQLFDDMLKVADGLVTKAAAAK